MGNILKIENLSFKFNQKEKFFYDNISLEFDSGINFIKGKNGSGKSTLLKIISGNIKNNEIVMGNLIFDNNSYNLKNNSDIKKIIMFIHQNYNEMLSDEFSAKKNIQFANFPKYPKLKFVSQKIDLDHFSLPINQTVKFLSGGQKQILAILMAIQKKARILLLDEPTAALDEKNSFLVMDFLKQLAQQNNLIIICVCHEQDLINKYSDEYFEIKEDNNSKFIEKSVVKMKENNYNLPTINFLKAKNVSYKILHLDSVAKTVKDVERLYGCSIKQILKTLVLISNQGPIITIVQGDKKISFEKLIKLFDLRDLRFAQPNEIKNITGYEIGGVSPFGIESDIKKVIDIKAFDETKLNFGAGTTNIGIEISSNDLKNIWDGKIEDIT